MLQSPEHLFKLRPESSPLPAIFLRVEHSLEDPVPSVQLIFLSLLVHSLPLPAHSRFRAIIPTPERLPITRVQLHLLRLIQAIPSVALSLAHRISANLFSTVPAGNGLSAQTLKPMERVLQLFLSQRAHSKTAASPSLAMALLIHSLSPMVPSSKCLALQLIQRALLPIHMARQVR